MILWINDIKQCRRAVSARFVPKVQRFFEMAAPFIAAGLVRHFDPSYHELSTSWIVTNNGSFHIEQIRVTVILNIHEVETSSTAELICRRREFTEMSDHHVFWLSIVTLFDWCHWWTRLYAFVWPNSTALSTGYPCILLCQKPLLNWHPQDLKDLLWPCWT